MDRINSTLLGFMLSRNSIAVRFLVWVAALLIPAEAMPMLGCGCAGGGAVAADPVRKASCCRKGTAQCCCQGKSQSLQGCCCCPSGKSSPTSGCRCAKNHSAPTPAPGPNNTQTETAKTLASAHASPAIHAIATTVVGSLDIHFLSLPGQTSLERLNSLCRLVV